MPRFDISRILFWSVGIACVLGGTFMFGLYSGARENFAYRAVSRIKSGIEDALSLTSQEAPTLLGTRPDWFLQPAYYPGSGVTVNETTDDDRILLAGFFEDGNQIRLIERDGTVVARWPVAFSELFPDTSHIHQPPATDWNKDMHGTLILPDGSVVFNFEQAGLVELDRCGSVAWTLARETHHSVELAESGGFWVPSRNFVTSDAAAPDYPPFEKPYYEDTILRVSDLGTVLDETSVVSILYENGMEALLTATGTSITAGAAWDLEILHLNKVGELGSDIAGDFPAFAAGDLLLSIRELNMLLVVDPATKRIKWWKVGPWVRQHDPDFEAGGRISVFNNGTYRTVFGTDNPFSRTPLSAPRVSSIVVVDPVNGETEVAYGNREGQRFLSVIRGKHQSTSGGGWLITEHDGGRVFETDAEGKVIWEFINRYNADEVAEITEARVYAHDYFDVADWSCAETNH